jgi:phosphoglycolate phosphatase
MKLLLFDLDGTLVSTGGAGLRALDRAFEDLWGVAGAMDGITPHGKTDPRIVQEIFERKLGRPPTPPEMQAACARYLDFLPEEIRRSDQYQVMDGIRPLLDDLSRRKNVVLALGTGNLEAGARIKLEPSGLNPYFPFGGFGSDAERRDDLLRAAVRRARERLDRTVAGKDVFVIGDTALDVNAGRAVGAVTVGVAFGFGQRQDLVAAKPDILLESFARAEELLDRL